MNIIFGFTDPGVKCDIVFENSGSLCWPRVFEVRRRRASMHFNLPYGRVLKLAEQKKPCLASFPYSVMHHCIWKAFTISVSVFLRPVRLEGNVIELSSLSWSKIRRISHFRGKIHKIYDAITFFSSFQSPCQNSFNPWSCKMTTSWRQLPGSSKAKSQKIALAIIYISPSYRCTSLPKVESG